MRDVRALSPRLARKAGIDKRVHSHGFRHAFAFEQAMAGVPLPVIRAQLGHVWMKSTDAYLDHVAPLEAVYVTRSRTWTHAPSPSGDREARDSTTLPTGASAWSV